MSEIIAVAAVVLVWVLYDILKVLKRVALALEEVFEAVRCTNGGIWRIATKDDPKPTPEFWDRVLQKK